VAEPSKRAMGIAKEGKARDTDGMCGCDDCARPRAEAIDAYAAEMVAEERARCREWALEHDEVERLRGIDSGE
jgi:hypothetical protein